MAFIKKRIAPPSKYQWHGREWEPTPYCGQAAPPAPNHASPIDNTKGGHAGAVEVPWQRGAPQRWCRAQGRGRRRDTLSLAFSKEGRDGSPSRPARRAIEPPDVGDEVRQATQVPACLRGHVTQANGAGIGRGPIWRGGACAPSSQGGVVGARPVAPLGGRGGAETNGRLAEQSRTVWTFRV